MRDKNKIDLIRIYKHCITVPEGFTLHDRSHSTCNEVAISVQDDEGKSVDVWKDRIWLGDYEFNDRQDYWWFDLKTGYEFLQPIIDKIFADLQDAKVTIAEAKARRDQRVAEEKKEAEQTQINKIKARYVKKEENTQQDLCPSEVYKQSTRDDLE